MPPGAVPAATSSAVLHLPTVTPASALKPTIPDFQLEPGSLLSSGLTAPSDTHGTSRSPHLFPVTILNSAFSLVTLGWGAVSPFLLSTRLLHKVWCLLSDDLTLTWNALSPDLLADSSLSSLSLTLHAVLF